MTAPISTPSTASAAKRAAKRAEREKTVVLSNGDVELVCVPQSQIWMVSSAVWAMLDPALAQQRGMTKVEILRKDCAAGRSQLWFVLADRSQVLAVAVTEVLQYPAKKMFCVAWLGGTQMRRWIEFFEIFKDLAKKQGCDGIEVHGRRGWERALRRWGMRFDRLVVSHHFTR
jgi:hypothetical protein